MWPAAGTSRRDDVGRAIAVDIGHRCAHAARERCVVGVEGEPFLAGQRIIDAHLGRAAGIGPAARN